MMTDGERATGCSGWLDVRARQSVRQAVQRCGMSGPTARAHGPPRSTLKGKRAQGSIIPARGASVCVLVFQTDKSF